MKMNPKETGKRIQLLRKQKGLSQEELADKLNVSSNTVAKKKSKKKEIMIF